MVIAEEFGLPVRQLTICRIPHISGLHDRAGPFSSSESHLWAQILASLSIGKCQNTVISLARVKIRFCGEGVSIFRISLISEKPYITFNITMILFIRSQFLHLPSPASTCLLFCGAAAASLISSESSSDDFVCSICSECRSPDDVSAKSERSF